MQLQQEQVKMSSCATSPSVCHLKNLFAAEQLPLCLVGCPFVIVCNASARRNNSTWGLSFDIQSSSGNVRWRGCRKFGLIFLRPTVGKKLCRSPLNTVYRKDISMAKFRLEVMPVASHPARVTPMSVPSSTKGQVMRQHFPRKPSNTD